MDESRRARRARQRWEREMLRRLEELDDLDRRYGLGVSGPSQPPGLTGSHARHRGMPRVERHRRRTVSPVLPGLLVVLCLLLVRVLQEPDHDRRAAAAVRRRARRQRRVLRVRGQGHQRAPGRLGRLPSRSTTSSTPRARPTAGRRSSTTRCPVSRRPAASTSSRTAPATTARPTAARATPATSCRSSSAGPPPTRSRRLQGDTVGIGGSSAVTANGETRFVTGVVVLDEQEYDQMAAGRPGPRGGPDPGPRARARARPGPRRRPEAADEPVVRRAARFRRRRPRRAQNPPRHALRLGRTIGRVRDGRPSFAERRAQRRRVRETKRRMAELRAEEGGRVAAWPGARGWSAPSCSWSSSLAVGTWLVDPEIDGTSAGTGCAAWSRTSRRGRTRSSSSPARAAPSAGTRANPSSTSSTRRARPPTGSRSPRRRSRRSPRRAASTSPTPGRPRPGRWTRSGIRGAPLLISWADPQEVPALAEESVGVALTRIARQGEPLLHRQRCRRPGRADLRAAGERRRRPRLRADPGPRARSHPRPRRRRRPRRADERGVRRAGRFRTGRPGGSARGARRPVRVDPA